MDVTSVNGEILPRALFLINILHYLQPVKFYFELHGCIVNRPTPKVSSGGQGGCHEIQVLDRRLLERLVG